VRQDGRGRARIVVGALSGVLRPIRIRAMLRDVILSSLLLAVALAAEPVSTATPTANPTPTSTPTPTATPTATATATPTPTSTPTATATSALVELLARADAAYLVRDEPGKPEEIQAALDEALRLAPADGQVLWRLARLEAWRSEDPALTKDRKSEIGKRAWDLAERAIAADPTRVEAWFYAMSGIGNYSLGLGIISALAKGMEGKFKDRLGHAEQLDPGFDRGAIPCAWGRFWFELPWPKHDARKSELALRAALERNPDNVRAHVYLGDLHLDEDRKAEARAEYQAALAKLPGQYDAPEERRWQGVARAALAKLGGK
jgi:tetratricopeptide (TPR) repeat protein